MKPGQAATALSAPAAPAYSRRFAPIKLRHCAVLYRMAHRRTERAFLHAEEEELQRGCAFEQETVRSGAALRALSEAAMCSFGRVHNTTRFSN